MSALMGCIYLLAISVGLFGWVGQKFTIWNDRRRAR